MMRHLLVVLEKCARTLTLTSSEQATLDEQINLNRSLLYVFEGKRNLNTRQAKAALKDFERANQHLRSIKLKLVILFLRYMPGLAVRVLGTRERLLTKQTSNELAGFDQHHV